MVFDMVQKVPLERVDTLVARQVNARAGELLEGGIKKTLPKRQPQWVTPQST